MEKKKISKWVILVTLAIGFIMATVDASIMNVAVSTIQTKLFITSAVSTWIVDAYLLSFASLLLFGGTLANKYGSKRIYLIGLIIFIVGSIFGGFSQNGASLISSRFFQGIGATLFMPSSLSLLIVSFKDPKERATMIGLWSAIVSISSGIGPFIGGSLIALLGWQSIFFINVPIGIVGYVLAKKYIGDNEGDKELTLTILPNILSMLMLGAFAFTLIEGGMHGWSYKPLIISITIFIMSTIVFIMSELKFERPLIPKELLKNRKFVYANIVGVLLNSAMFGGLFMFGLFLQRAKDMRSLETGAMMIPMMIVFLIGNLIFSRLVKSNGVHNLFVIGLCIATIGTALLPFVLEFPYIVYAFIYAIANLGVGIVVPAMTSTAMQRAGDQYSNMSSSILNVARQVGSLFGVALMGVVFYGASSPLIGAQYTFGIMTFFYMLSIILAVKSK